MNRTLAPWTAPERPDSRTVRSGDGALVVTMRRTPDGVFVERVIRQPGSARVVQAVVFATAGQFMRWCDADRARFDYPLVYASLTRHADALFAARTDPVAAG